MPRSPDDRASKAMPYVTPTSLAFAASWLRPQAGQVRLQTVDHHLMFSGPDAYNAIVDRLS
jgi:hypothetical protein